MYRTRTVENVADEMRELRRKRGARMFVFHDDDFFTRDKEHDLARMTALRGALREREVNDIAMVVKARPDDVDKDVFDVLEDIGLLRVYLGIEADDETLARASFDRRRLRLGLRDPRSDGSTSAHVGRESRRSSIVASNSQRNQEIVPHSSGRPSILSGLNTLALRWWFACM